jgi:hypothetical protein
MRCNRRWVHTASTEYVAVRTLGGLRHARKDSINTGWRNSGFRGYADYMQTGEFAEGLEQLMALSLSRRTAIMCAEAVPWRCHRSLVADALSVRGIPGFLSSLWVITGRTSSRRSRVLTAPRSPIRPNSREHDCGWHGSCEHREWGNRDH